MASTSYNYDARLDKAVMLWINHHVTKLGPGRFTVTSQSVGGTVYHVTDGVCNCFDCQKWHLPCKHSLAADLLEAELQEIIDRRAALKQVPVTVVTDAGAFRKLSDGRFLKVDGAGQPWEDPFEPDAPVIFDALPRAA